MLNKLFTNGKFFNNIIILFNNFPTKDFCLNDTIAPLAFIKIRTIQGGANLPDPPKPINFNSYAVFRDEGVKLKYRNLKLASLLLR